MMSQSENKRERGKPDSIFNEKILNDFSVSRSGSFGYKFGLKGSVHFSTVCTLLSFQGSCSCVFIITDSFKSRKLGRQKQQHPPKCLMEKVGIVLMA